MPSLVARYGPPFSRLMNRLFFRRSEIHGAIGQPVAVLRETGDITHIAIHHALEVDCSTLART